MAQAGQMTPYAAMRASRGLPFTEAYLMTERALGSRVFRPGSSQGRRIMRRALASLRRAKAPTR